MFDPYQEEEMYEERIAICMFDGGLPYPEAVKIAARQMFDAMQAFDKAQRANHIPRWREAFNRSPEK